MTAFRQSNMLLLMQQVVTSVGILAGSSVGLLQCRHLEWGMAQKSLGVVLLYNANVAFALGSLSKLNVPMYNVLKRLTPIFVLGGKMLFSFGRSDPPSQQVSGAVAVMILSTLVAGAGDLAFDLNGYLLGLTSCVLQAAYLLLVERTGTEKELNSTELMLYNGVLSAPFLLVVTLLNGEFAATPGALSQAQDETGFLLFWVLLGFTLVGGCILNYALFLCTMTKYARIPAASASLPVSIPPLSPFFLELPRAF